MLAARPKGIGALITTFGVGELSAVNAIAGAYAERVPVVHIVGTPDRALDESRARVHHTFNDGDYHRFDKMQEHITVAQVSLNDLRTSAAQIDAVLEQCLLHSRPVRIAIPVDMVSLPVSTARLATAITLPSLSVQAPAETPALHRVLERIYACKQPMILVDGESRALDILGEIDVLVQTTGWPTFTSGFGKSLVDETLPNVLGVYKPAHKAFGDSCDLILCFGPHHSTTNTYGGLTVPRADATIAFSSTTVQIGTEIFRDLPAKAFLRKLTMQLDSSLIAKSDPASTLLGPKPTADDALLPPVSGSDPVAQTAGFWQRLSRAFFRPGDVILAETGTAGYGANDFVLPKHTRLFKPVTWLSIGYMLPAALGASLAQRDNLLRASESASNGKSATSSGTSSSRTILLIGDGSFQMTAQELSTIIHHKLDVVVFLINNDGYTIERCIHGRDQAYNDVAPWRYLKAPAFFGAPDQGEHAAHTWQIRTWDDFTAVMNDANMLHGKGLRMVEIFMERLDAPELLLGLLQKQIEREKFR